MKKAKKIAAIILACCTLITVFSCSQPQKSTAQKRIFYGYFDTIGTFYDYSGMSKSKFEETADKVEQSLSIYHKLYDIYNEYEGITNLKAVNDNAGKGAVAVDRKIIDMLIYSKEMYEMTGGAVNIAMGAVLEIWHDYREAGVEVPPKEMLQEASNHTDINSVVIDEEGLTVELLDPKMRLDVGAIAKGYAVEMTAKMLESDGNSGLVLDVGGNLRAVGAKPNGEGWSAAIKDPSSPYSQTYIYKTEIKNAALVTSGSYERFYTVNGVRYHHIINGETLMPENYYLSVSVKSESSALSDALSTAIFNMEYEKAVSFTESLDGIFVVLVMPSGEIKTLGK